MLLLPACARADGYLYPAGQGQVIVTSVFTEASHDFGTGGRFVPTRDFQKFEASAYVEYGLTPWLTLVAAPTFTRGSFAPDDVRVQANAANSAAGVRVPLASIAGVSFALQADGLVPSPRLGRNTALLTSASGGADLRLAADFAFALGNWPSFVEAEAIQTWHVGAAPNEVEGDLTLGTRPWPRLLLLLQSFNFIADGRARAPFLPDRENKVEASAVYDFNAAWALQAGVLATVAGVNVPAERGGVLGVWRRF